MLEIRDSKDGALLAVKVTPRASADKLAGIKDGRILVRLSAPPVDGKANQALVKYLAKALGLAKSGLEVVAGHKSRQKTVLARGISAAKAAQKLGL